MNVYLDDLFQGNNHDDIVIVGSHCDQPDGELPHGMFGGKVRRWPTSPKESVEIAVTDNGTSEHATVWSVRQARKFALAILEVCDG